MKVTIKKYKENAKITQEGSIIQLHANNAEMAKAPDGSPVFVYSTGVGVQIPQGYAGLLVPAADLELRSVYMTNADSVILPGNDSEIICKFKLNTISVPVIYSVDEALANIVIFKIPDDIEVSIENVKGETEINNPEEVTE